MNDSISNFIVKLKNANNAGKESVVFPYSKMIAGIADILFEHGFVGAVGRKGKKMRNIEITLIYDNDTPKIKGFKRLSKLSRRVYMGYRQIRPVMRGYGLMVISTPKGLMTGSDAIKEKSGGEPIFRIW